MIWGKQRSDWFWSAEAVLPSVPDRKQCSPGLPTPVAAPMWAFPSLLPAELPHHQGGFLHHKYLSAIMEGLHTKHCHCHTETKTATFRQMPWNNSLDLENSYYRSDACSLRSKLYSSGLKNEAKCCCTGWLWALQPFVWDSALWKGIGPSEEQRASHTHWLWASWKGLHHLGLVLLSCAQFQQSYNIDLYLSVFWYGKIISHVCWFAHTKKNKYF